MAESTEFSRLLIKGTSTSGVEPTVPSTETIDETWIATDLKQREFFYNSADNRLWVRSVDGINEIPLGGTGATDQTTDATPTTFATIATTTDSVILVESVVVGIKDDQKRAYGSTILSVYRNDSGTLSSVGETLTEHSDFTTATSGSTTSGTNILIQVTGEAATNIDWTVKTKVTYLTNV